MSINHAISRSQLRSSNSLFVGATALACLLCAYETRAEEVDERHPLLSSEYSINIGVFFPEREFEIGVDGSIPSIQRDFDISEQLNLSNSETTQAYEIGWRFKEKWMLRGQYFEVGGSRSAVLEDDVIWGDLTFGAGTGVRGGIDVSITRLFVGRRFSDDAHQEWGVGLGVHRLDLSANIAGQAIINDEPPIFAERTVSTHGPLPNLGAWYIYAFNSKWAFTTRLDWLSASIDKYSGTIINAAAGINYAFNRHFQVGANYNYFRLEVDVTDDPWRGFAESTIDGGFLYLSFHW